MQALASLDLIYVACLSKLFKREEEQYFTNKLFNLTIILFFTQTI